VVGGDGSGDEFVGEGSDVSGAELAGVVSAAETSLTPLASARTAARAG
jgi:hypothetical protein